MNTPAATPNVVAPRRTIATPVAIALFRRWIWVGTAIKALLWVLLGTSVVIGAALMSSVGYPLLLLVAILWIGLLVPSYRTAQLAMRSGPLIAAGQLEQAEDQLGRSMRGFSLIKTGKLVGLQQLGLLRHAQKRWSESVQLLRELLSQQRASDVQMQKSSRLVLIDSLLELGDVASAGTELAQVEQMPMELKELMSLTALRLDWRARVNQWPAIFAETERATALAEIMPAKVAARVQAVLALAARKVGREDWAQYLTRRAELLVDLDELVSHRPMLWELWSARGSANVPPTSA